jgi:mono/diheme cytochrome c family protein
VLSSGVVRRMWLLVIAGPTLALLVGSALTLAFLPHPVPKTATGARRAYLTHCASCHGADGRGSWRATLFLMKPGNLADAALLASLGDEYLFSLIKHGGAPLGKPGMPAFGYHLSDEQIRELIAYLRTFPTRQLIQSTSGTRGSIRPRRAPEPPAQPITAASGSR